MEPIKLIGLGSCLVSEALDPLLRSGRAESALRKVRMRTSSAYCLDEAIQFARFVTGELDVPVPLRPLCDMDPSWKWEPAWGEALAECELVLVEAYSPIRIGLGPYSFVRGSMINHITDPLRARNEELRKPLHSWWYQGLLAGNESVRAETGKLLSEAVDDDFPNADVAREVLRDARSYRRTEAELIQGVEEIQRLLQRQIFMLVPIHQYLPDGRQVPWPPEFLDQVVAAARALNLPTFTPADVVKAYGVDKAWKGANGPYKEEFWPVLGDALFDFMQATLPRAASHNRQPEKV